MANFDTWLTQGNEPISVTSRAVDAWNRINRNPTSITIIQKDETELAAQTVRIEFDNSMDSERKGDGGGGGMSARRDAIVFGVKNHPTVTDTNIQRGDRFAVNGQIYRVVQVILVPGEVQATCEVLS